MDNLFDPASIRMKLMMPSARADNDDEEQNADGLAMAKKTTEAVRFALELKSYTSGRTEIQQLLFTFF